MASNKELLLEHALKQTLDLYERVLNACDLGSASLDADLIKDMNEVPIFVNKALNYEEDNING